MKALKKEGRCAVLDKRVSAFVISLDFELFWGVRDHSTINRYGANILGERQAIPAMLEVFREREIACTWATLGVLFARNRDDLKKYIPEIRPQYANPALDPYRDIDQLGHDQRDDPYHFAPDLLDMIQAIDRQEIATHTFGHFYCLEKGATPQAFGSDLDAATAIMARNGLKPDSIVFPRNQYADPFIQECAVRDIFAYRGNESHPIYATSAKAEQAKWQRAMRLTDAYLNLTGTHVQHPARDCERKSVNVASSRFLRPYSNRLAVIEGLRRTRILSAMDAAVENGGVFHLWFHPHNFGINLDNNLNTLRIIVDHFVHLREKYGWQNLTMREVGLAALR